MRLLSGFLCAALAFNAAARLYSQTNELCRAASSHAARIAVQNSVPSPGLSLSRARRRRPTVARVSFLVAPISHPARSRRLDAVAAAGVDPVFSAEAAPPDHPPA